MNLRRSPKSVLKLKISTALSDIRHSQKCDWLRTFAGYKIKAALCDAGMIALHCVCVRKSLVAGARGNLHDFSAA